MYGLVLTLKIILLVLMVLSAAFVIFAIVKQPGNSSGSDAITGAGTTDTFYGKNKAKRFENQLKKWTIISGVILAVSAVLFFIIGLL